MRVRVVDPAAYTPPYDHALCAALAHAGAQVTLSTTTFDLGAVAPPDGYTVDRAFYRRTRSGAGGLARRVSRLAQHVPDMLRERRQPADVHHYQWLPVPQVDDRLLPTGHPVVLTAHDVLPREPQPGQRAGLIRAYGRADAIVVHSEHGRGRLIDEAGVDPARVHVIPHGAFTRVASLPEGPLPPELADTPPDRPVVLCFGLMRPYKGIDVLLDAWRGVDGADLWIVGRPRMDIAGLRAAAPPNVRFVPRFITDAEQPALFRRADLVVLPYREIDQSGVLFTALAFGRPLLLTDVGGFPEVAATGAARLVPSGDADQLRDALRSLVADPAARDALAQASARAGGADGPYAWPAIARAHLDLYRALTV
jgi:glycosyltransferase involved in cell wall biosynthesis